MLDFALMFAAGCVGAIFACMGCLGCLCLDRYGCFPKMWSFSKVACYWTMVVLWFAFLLGGGIYFLSKNYLLYFGSSSPGAEPMSPAVPIQSW